MNNQTKCNAVNVLEYICIMYVRIYTYAYWILAYVSACTFAALNFDLFCGWQTSFDCQRLCLCFGLSLFRFVHFSSLQNRSTLPQLTPTPTALSILLPSVALLVRSRSRFKFPVFKFTNRSLCRQHDSTQHNSTRLDSLANPTNC